MSEPTVQIVELEQQKVGFVLVDVVVRRQVDWHVYLALDDADEVQVLFDFFHIYGHLIEFYWFRSQVLFLDIQVEDVEKRQP